MTGLIEAPSSRDFADSLLDERRTNVHTRLLSRIISVQSKDIPIIVLAFEHRTRELTILTNDGDFAAFPQVNTTFPKLTLNTLRNPESQVPTYGAGHHHRHEWVVGEEQVTALEFEDVDSHLAAFETEVKHY